MTRAREVEPGSGDIPEYKSPLNRLVHSLRNGYDNLRVKLEGLRNNIKFYQIKVRDLENSRDQWKKKAIEHGEKIKLIEKRYEKLETRSQEALNKTKEIWANTEKD